jgi:hypothetical protein
VSAGGDRIGPRRQINAAIAMSPRKSTTSTRETLAPMPLKAKHRLNMNRSRSLKGREV